MRVCTMTTARSLIIALLCTLPLTGCSPAFEFLVFNASTASVALRAYQQSCTAEPGAACNVRGYSFTVHQDGVIREYRPVEAAGGGALMDAAETPASHGFLVRLRFDGRSMYLVAPKDNSWTPVGIQPRGFPLEAAKSPQ